jgi:hypothetical protein
MKTDFDGLTRRFLEGDFLKEGKSPDINSYIQTLGEILDNFKPKSISEKRRLDAARDQLREIRRHTRRMQSQIHILEEKLVILEENKDT